MTELTIDLRITIASPVLVQATEPDQPDLDSSPLRMLQLGLPLDPTPGAAAGVRAVAAVDCLPGSTLKGQFRDALRMFEALEDRIDADWILDAFGEEVGGKGRGGGTVTKPYGSGRSRIEFEDALLETPPPSEPSSHARAHRIAIDPERGSVDEGMLQVIELPAPPLAELLYTSRVWVRARDRAQALLTLRRLQRAGAALFAIGSNRTTGFGEVLRIDWGVPRESRFAGRVLSGTKPSAKAAGRVPLELYLELTTRSPLCVVEDLDQGNLFVSGDTIPGGALKGALARSWCCRLGLDEAHHVRESTDDKRRALGRNFSRLRFCHALPVFEGEQRFWRPPRTPLSVAEATAEEEAEVRSYVDLSAWTVQQIEQADPRFRPDWKSDGPDVGWPSLLRALRTRTAIDTEFGRARDEDLFSYEMVLPIAHVPARRPQIRLGRPVVWRSLIRLDDVPDQDRANVLQELQEVIKGCLEGSSAPVPWMIGKTKAPVEPRLHLNWPLTGVPKVADEASIVSMLESPSGCAVLLRADALLVDGERFGAFDGGQPTPGEKELEAAYRAYWQQVVPGSELRSWFSAEMLRGGQYFLRRFPKRYPAGYFCDLVTRAGSVFVLGSRPGDSARAAQALARCLERGLACGLFYPANDPRSAMPLWMLTPYVPENGWGEIAVDRAGNLYPPDVSQGGCQQ